MDFINTALVTINQPTGVWETILNAFKGAMGSYILAVILIAVLVRIVFSLVDIINKKVNMKNSNINAKMKPELDAVQKKYEHDQRLLQQKQNEIYKKYQFSMLSSCLPMLLTMVLQFTVFLTLWNSLQTVSNYNIVEKYEEVKDVYANVINLNHNVESQSLIYEEGYKYLVEIKNDTVNLIKTNIETTEKTVIATANYEKDWSNEEIYSLLETYVIEPSSEEDSETEAEVYTPNTLSAELVKIAEKLAEEYYNNSQEKFLWIKNIYRSESPTSPLFTKSEITKLISNYYTDEEKTLEEEYKYEENIFETIIEKNDQFDSIRNQKNGYYILTIIAVIVSFLSMWLSNFLMRNKNQPQQKQNMLMYIIMPLIFGIFTFMYTSLFAIYIIVGQLIMIALTPLTTWIVRKWVELESKKKQDKAVVEVDYRRKDS